MNRMNRLSRKSVNRSNNELFVLIDHHPLVRPASQGSISRASCTAVHAFETKGVYTTGEEIRIGIFVAPALLAIEKPKRV